MATSGTIAYNLNVRGVIDYALHKLRVLGAGETATAEQAAAGVRELNVLLKNWMRYENLWRQSEGSITLVGATSSYTLTPVPFRVTTARFRNASGIDTPMIPLTREEYYDFPLKTAAGIPTQFYVDYQRTSAVFYTWPVIASVTTETIKYTYHRKFEDVATLDEDVDVRQEYFDVLGYNLAARLADDFGRASPVTDRVIARAQMMLEQALDEDREDQIRFVAGRR